MSLEEEFLSILEKNKKFRLAVASYLGYEEILKRISEHDAKFEAILREIKLLREGQEKLWESQKKLWEGQERLWESQKKLWEGQEKLWKEIRYLRAEVESFGKAVGRTLEDYTRAFVKIILEERGYPKEKINIKRNLLVYNGKVIEINVFNEDPLVVGEVTTYISDIEEAKKEVSKVLEHVRICERIYNRGTEFALLAIANAPFGVVEELKKLAKEQKITLIYGREII
jgi:hypothetical protein